MRLGASLVKCLFIVLFIPQSQASELFTSEDIFQLEYASEPQVSPDGKQVIYVRNSNNIMTDGKNKSLWLVDIKSKQQTPLFSDNHQYSQPRWSPDGEKFAFVSNMSGSYQIHVHYLKTNTTAMLSQLQSGIRDLTWSPDGKWLAFSQLVKSKPPVSAKLPKKPKGAKWAKPVVMIDKAYYQADGVGLLKSGYRHIFVLTADGGTPKQITQGNFHHSGKLAWMPDSSAIVFSANRIKDWEYKSLEGDLWQIDINSNKLTQLTSAAGTEYYPSFSPDGKTLAYLSYSNAANPYRNHKLNLMNWAKKKSNLVAKDFDRSIIQPTWLSNKKLAIAYDDFGKRKIATITTKGKIKDIVDDVSGTTLGRPYISGQFNANSSGKIAYTKGDSQSPADIGVISGDKSAQLTQLNADLFAHKKLGQVHEINYKSSFDGEAIQGWYITPPNFDPKKKYPLIIEIHGGPHLAYGPQTSLLSYNVLLLKVTWCFMITIEVVVLTENALPCC